MSLVRHFALLLALAIATIAITLTSSTAQAHDGHRHATAPTLPLTTPAAVVRDAATVTVRAEARLDCSGPCCAAGGHHGSCCCATGLAPAAPAPALPPMASARSLAREHASPASIVPEALPEPPRSFA